MSDMETPEMKLLWSEADLAGGESDALERQREQQEWTKGRLKELPGRNRLRFDTGLGRYVIERYGPVLDSAGEKRWSIIASFANMEAVVAFLGQVERNVGTARAVMGDDEQDR